MYSIAKIFSNKLLMRFLRIATFAAGLLPPTTLAQTALHPAEEVSTMENNFAKKALASSTKEAFLAFYADDVVVFRQGNPVNGKKDWNNRNADSSELWWRPAFADIASSGDFGYTMGPWEFKKTKNADTPTAYGYYNSIWKKINGEWKVVVDIGVPTPGPSPERNTPTKYASTSSSADKINYEQLKKNLTAMENNFLTEYQTNAQQAYKKYISSEARLCRPNQLPLTSVTDITNAIGDTSLHFSFSQSGGDVASSGDMGYIYGMTRAVGKYRDQPVDIALSYLRVWKKETDNTWKIVLDVIGGR